MCLSLLAPNWIGAIPSAGQLLYSGGKANIITPDAIHLLDERLEEVTVLSVAHVGFSFELYTRATVAQVLKRAHNE